MAKSRFEYKPREKDAVKKRANQSGGLFDSLFGSKYDTFSIKEGDYQLRILPPTWEDAQHFGLDIFVHYGIGSDNQSYLCAEKMLGQECCLCEERKKAERAGDPEYAKTLSPTKRVLVWIIDRANEDAGPILWPMAWTIDRDLANLSIDKRTGEMLLIDDPENGYDVEFTKTGTGLKTKYSGIAVARRPSALSDDEGQVDEWLAFIQRNPLPDTLQYFDAEHIMAIAAGKKAKDDEDEEEAPTRSSRKRAKVDDEEEEDVKPAKKSKPKPVVDEEDDDEDLPPVRKPKPRVEEEDEDEEKPAPKKKPKPKPVEEDDEEEEPVKPVKKPKPIVKDEDEEEDEPRRPTSKKPTSRSEDEDDEEDEKPRKPKLRPVVEEEEDEADCIACNDTGKNSKGGYCVCVVGKKLKAKAAAKAAAEEE